MIVVPFAVRRPQPDLDPLERLPDDPPVRTAFVEAHRLFGYLGSTPLTCASKGLCWQLLKRLADVRKLSKRFHVGSYRLWVVKKYLVGNISLLS